MAKSKPNSKVKSKSQIEEEPEEIFEEEPELSEDEPEEAFEEEEALEEEDEEILEEDAEEAVEEDIESAFDEDVEESLDDEPEESLPAEEESEEAFDEEDFAQKDEGENEEALDEEKEDEEPLNEEEAVSEKAQMKSKGKGKKASEDDDEPETSSSRPAAKPQITLTTMFFIVLNWVAAAAFVWFAYNDVLVRLQFQHRAVVNYIGIWGLPLRDEEKGKMVWSESRPRLRFSPEQLRESFNSRKGGITKVPAKEEFVAVDEPVPIHLTPSDLNDAVLKDVFWDLPDPVRTLEEEIDRLKKRLPADIEKAAKDVLESHKKEDKNSDEEKRNTLRNVFLPIVWSCEAIGKLDDRITAASGEELNKLFLECVQRRMYYDILAPINLYRPGDLDKFTVEKIADLDGYEFGEIKELLVKRFEAAVADQLQIEHHWGPRWTKDQSSPDALKRNSVEKRQQIGFIMFTLGQVQVPKLKSTKLYAKGMERAQVVCGIREFTSAGIAYVRTLRNLEERLAQAILNDRQGYTIETKDGAGRTTGKIDIHSAEIDRMVKEAESIEKQQKRLDHKRALLGDAEKIYKQRQAQHKEIVDKLIAARKNTERYINDLRKLQDQLHGALVELSDAADRNFDLEAQIRKTEMSLQSQPKKGGKKQP